MINKYLTAATMLISIGANAQKEDIGWIAPEGKIINTRTLTWTDFQTKADRKQKLKAELDNRYLASYICPAVYFTTTDGQQQENGRVTFKFTTKCAFQSHAFLINDPRHTKTYSSIHHEQGHYDIALLIAKKLHTELSTRDYDGKRYNEEIDEINDRLHKEHVALQHKYDEDVDALKPDNEAAQRLWDMRFRKASENNDLTLLSANLTVANTVKSSGTLVKRLAGETPVQFLVRCRPLYSFFNEENAQWVKETTEWGGNEPTIIAYFTHSYFESQAAEAEPKSILLAYMYVPTAKDTYKRIFLDTLASDGSPVKITGTYFANTDADPEKELIIMAAGQMKGKEASGTLYMNRVFDNVTRPVQNRAKKLTDVTSAIDGELEGTRTGKASKAKYKTFKDVEPVLAKMVAK